MTSLRIADRMRDFFQRQLSWLDRWSREFANAGDENATEDQWEQLAEGFARYQGELLQLEEEFYLLEREWQAATDITDEERSEVIALAQRAREEASVMARWFNENAQRAADKRDGVRDELQQFRRTSGAVKKYFGSVEGVRGGRVDRDA